jgi:hypothetical protein
MHRSWFHLGDGTRMPLNGGKSGIVGCIKRM